MNHAWCLHDWGDVAAAFAIAGSLWLLILTMIVRPWR